MAAPYVHVWLHSAHAHSPRAAYAPQHPAWIVLAFLDRAGNLVLILIGPHAIDSCTACRSTDSFAATTGNVPPLSFGRTAHRRKHHYNQGPQHSMIVHLAMMLSAVHGWVLLPDDKAHDSSHSAHESAITGGVDGARARRQLVASSCDGSWSARPPRPSSRSPLPNRVTRGLRSCPQRHEHV